MRKNISSDFQSDFLLCVFSILYLHVCTINDDACQKWLDSMSRINTKHFFHTQEKPCRPCDTPYIHTWTHALCQLYVGAWKTPFVKTN